MDSVVNFLIELDKLKSVYRMSYLGDLSRKENAAEHSWHMALAILSMGKMISPELNLNHAVKLALVHDIPEIGAGDRSVYDPLRDEQIDLERIYLDNISAEEIPFSQEIKTLWEEYQSQETIESKCVKVLDRFLPFISNINTNGQSWLDQDISTRQVREINQIIKKEAPVLYEWMDEQINKSAEKGLLAQ